MLEQAVIIEALCTLVGLLGERGQAASELRRILSLLDEAAANAEL